MSAQRLFIKRKNPVQASAIAAPTDFHYEPGPALQPEAIMRDPSVSLYCLEPELRRALLVEMPADVDLSGVPFAYATQRELCTGLVAVPYETFHRMASDVNVVEDDRLIVIYSVGRCGSTLAAKALSAIPEVHGLSEPDVLTQLTVMRSRNGQDDRLTSELLASAIRFLFKGRPRQGRPTHWMVKPRSHAIELADLMFEQFPRAKCVFVYRNALTWLESVFRRFLHGHPLASDAYNRESEALMMDLNPLVARDRRSDRPMSPARLWILSWIRAMERYLELRSMGVPINAMRFEDLLADGPAFIRRLLELCDIRSIDPAALYPLLQHDSQAGTWLEKRANPTTSAALPTPYRDEALATIADRRSIAGPDVLLPATWTLSS